MGAEKNIKKQRVWQDIKPSQPKQKLVIKKTTKISIFLVFLSRSFHKIKILTLKTAKKRYIFTLFIVISITFLCYLLFTFQFKKIISTNNSLQTITSNPREDLIKGTPDYQTVLPSSKKIDDLGGWTRISPTNTDPVFAYADKLENVSINVSEQLLPNDFKTDTENKIEKLSQGFKASEKITIGSTIVHIGTSANGPQSVIFTLNGLLILIKSDTKINNNEWAKYINSMQ